MLAPGLVFKVEMVLRIEDLHEFGDGRRWRVGILEIGQGLDLEHGQERQHPEGERGDAAR